LPTLLNDVSFLPSPAYRGIGWLIEPSRHFDPQISNTEQIMMLDHSGGNYSPDKQIAWVQYEFSKPADVRELEAVQHTAGIKELKVETSDDGKDFTFLADGSSRFDSKTLPPDGQPDVFYLNVSTAPPPREKFLKESEDQLFPRNDFPGKPPCWLD
jgi:hypothetical protein